MPLHHPTNHPPEDDPNPFWPLTLLWKAFVLLCLIAGLAHILRGGGLFPFRPVPPSQAPAHPSEGFRR